MKTKRIISLLASLAMMVTAVTGAMSVSAETDSGDCGEVKWSFDSSTGKLTISGEGKMATPEIPESSVSFPAGDYSDIYSYKEYKEDIKEVVIEEGVTSIGFCAFYQFPNLETVVLPSSITDFLGLNGKTSVTSYSFAECKSLKNLTLTEGMTAIGGYSFYGCVSLESVKIPSTIKKWGDYSFYKCSKLKDITLPEGLTIMGAYAFSETAVEHIVIPSTIKEWYKINKGNEYSHEGCAFAGCLKLSSVTFKEGIKQINYMIFENCPLLKKVVIPASVTYLCYTFEGCTGIEEVYIEDGAQIGGSSYFSGAFQNCTSLRKIEIPEGVQTIWTGANWCTGCNALTDVYVHGIDQGLPYSITSNESIKIHCNYGSKLYQSTSNDRKITFKEEIPEILKNLNTAIEEAEKYAEEYYTPESYGALKTALDNAKKFDENSTFVLPIEWAADDIMTAIEGLEEKKDEPPSSDPSDSSSNPSDSSNPSGSDQSQPSNSGSSQPTSAQPVTNAPTTATLKPTTPPTVTTTAKPAKIKNVKVKAKKKKLNVSWKKVSGATGYEVMSATNNKFTKNKKTVTVKKNKVTLKKLKPKKKYFVKVRAYKLANGRKYFGKWSKVVKKKTK